MPRRGRALRRTATACLLAPAVLALASCGASGNAHKTAVEGGVSAEEARQEEAALRKEEASEIAQDQEALSVIESGAREEEAEAAAKRTEARAKARAKKREKAADEAAKRKEKEAEAKKKREEAAKKAAEHTTSTTTATQPVTPAEPKKPVPAKTNKSISAPPTVTVPNQ